MLHLQSTKGEYIFWIMMKKSVLMHCDASLLIPEKRYGDAGIISKLSEITVFRGQSPL
jgi:hypothetical protein